MATGKKFTVHRGKRYQATLTLSGFEKFAGNSMIADRFAKLGFSDVEVTVSGSERSAMGRWTGADTTVEIDPHLSDIVEVA